MKTKIERLDEQKLAYKKIKELMDIDLDKADDSFVYQMLGRLQLDCSRFVDAGYDEIVLWAHSPRLHLEIMIYLYKSIDDERKPEWINLVDIENYGKLLGVSANDIYADIENQCSL